MHNPEMVDKSRHFARFFSNYDCIGIYINDRIECAIYKWSELPWRLIRSIKVRSLRTIASFNNNVKNWSVQFMNKVNCFVSQSDLWKSDLGEQ